MSKWYLYADAETKQVLEDSTEKILLVGSCFGHSNFGDILQLKGSVNFHKRLGRFNPVPIFSIEAITDPRYIAHAKKAYGIQAILFVSQNLLDAKNAGLLLQSEFFHVDTLHLYGGGFLNNKWGNYVTSVTEFLLENLKIENYAVSGQQIDLEFARRVGNHVKNFRPNLIGVRDPRSLHFLESQGVGCKFSFDDAYEELTAIVSRIPRVGSNRALVHLNLSGYTGNVNKEQELIHGLTTISSTCPNGIVAFNAFNEKGIEVIDTIRSIALLANEFPYHDYRVVDGSALAFHGVIRNFDALDVTIGFSCSYHVTLFMHLLGVPCYLSSNNSFYEQKRIALNCAKTLGEFLKKPEVPDYSKSIESRNSWLTALSDYFLNARAKASGQMKKLEFENLPSAVSFHYKSEMIGSLRDQLLAQEAYLVEIMKGKESLEMKWREQSAQLKRLQSATAVKLLKKIGVLSDA